MSGNDRKAFRAQVKAALDAAPFFAGYTAAWAWSQTLDAKELPIYAVATPQERQDRVTQDSAKCELTLIVILKLKGGEDIEDEMDEAGDATEALIVETLRTPHIQCDLTTTTTKIDGSGEQRVGTLDLVFGVTYWVDDPAPN